MSARLYYARRTEAFSSSVMAAALAGVPRHVYDVLLVTPKYRDLPGQAQTPLILTDHAGADETGPIVGRSHM
ncbi:hypothetical protein LshimejAT787_0200130 [Lyophyllum shimeji]|uniref:Uncharacterized protein n=1 Tax=Lyophyllum shimeji TaxID=47721 RepID=A0A9P3UII3_LYOSH|nr:hypothetical protein LshimejAT787_0200130 [Lyophyllum shimeji]